MIFSKSEIFRLIEWNFKQHSKAQSRGLGSCNELGGILSDMWAVSCEKGPEDMTRFFE